MNARTRRTRRPVLLAILAAKQVNKDLRYWARSGRIASLLAQGRLIRISDFLDRLNALDLKDGYQSWYGKHVKKAYMAATGLEPVQVWARHRKTGRWIHVAVYAPTDPSLVEGLRTYKRTQHLAVQADFAQAA